MTCKSLKLSLMHCFSFSTKWLTFYCNVFRPLKAGFGFPISHHVCAFLDPYNLLIMFLLSPRRQQKKKKKKRERDKLFRRKAISYCTALDACWAHFSAWAPFLFYYWDYLDSFLQTDVASTSY